MTKEQAALFIQALNLAQHYLPPLVFAQLVNNPVCNAVAAVANGMIELQPKSPAGNAAAAARPQ
jgi:hypothetical protein